MANGVACGAMRGKNVATLVLDVDRRRLLVTGFGVHCLSVTPTAEPVPDPVRKEPRIIGGRVAHPLSTWFVADQHARSVAIAIVGIGFTVKAKLFADEVNIGFLARQESPSRANMIFVPISLEHPGSVMRGINANGVKEDIFSPAVTQHLLHLRQPGSFQRT